MFVASTTFVFLLQQTLPFCTEDFCSCELSLTGIQKGNTIRLNGVLRSYCHDFTKQDRDTSQDQLRINVLRSITILLDSNLNDLQKSNL